MIIQITVRYFKKRRRFGLVADASSGRCGHARAVLYYSTLHYTGAVGRGAGEEEGRGKGGRDDGARSLYARAAG